MTVTQKIIKYCAIALAILLVVSIISGIVGVIAALVGVDAEKDFAEEPFDLAIDGDGSELRELVIELSATHLTVCRGDVVSVKTDSPYITCRQQDGVLTLEEEPHGLKLFGIQFSFGTRQTGNLILTLPDVVLDRLKLTAGAGEIRADALTAAKATLDFGAGNVELAGLTVTGELEIDGGVGDLTVKDGSWGSLDLDMGMGDVLIRGALQGDCRIDLGVGNARLEIVGDEADYRITLDKGIGKATVNGKSVKSGEAYGSGAHGIDVDGGIGSIDVIFVSEEDAA